MEPLSSSLLLNIAKAVLTQVAAKLAEPAAKGLRRRIFGDPEQRALEKALQRAYDTTRELHGYMLAQYDVNPSFLAYEGAAELAKTLIPGATASAMRLAERCVDSLSPDLDDDERAARVQALRPVFKTLVDSLDQEVRREEALRDLVSRDDTATTATAAARLVERLGAVSATDEDRFAYLRWVIDRNRYIRSTGMVRNTVIQLPLHEIFIGLPVRRERRAGDRTPIWFEREQEALRAKLASGELDQVGYEAALDRLQLQLGNDLRWAKEATAPQELPALDAVRDNQHLLVLGDPGSGKTTLLRYLALRHAQALLGKGGTAGLGDARLPIFVRIGDFARSPERHKGLGEFLWEHLRSQECPASGVRDLLRRALEAGDCLILLDGLDEIGSADDRRQVVAAVESLTTAHSRSGNRFVVTSRISGYAAAPLPPLFTAVRLQDMDDPTIERFLATYCPAVERAEAPEKSPEAVRHDAEAEARALLDALRLNPGVRRLAANPLLLTALVLVHRARGRLPHRRIEAYVEVTEALGRTWRSVQGVPEAELPDERLMTTWLTRLGAWLHEHRPEGSANKRELLRVLGPLWARHHGKEWDDSLLEAADPLDSEAGRGIDDFVSLIDRHTGLLVERAPGRYGFPHLTFEEYYAGRALASEGTIAERDAAIRRHLHGPRYEEPILLALGLIGQRMPEEVERVFAETIYPAPGHPKPYEDLLGWDFLFALRVLADDIPLTTSTIDALLRQAIDEWFDPENSRCRFLRYRGALADRIRGLKGTRAASRLLAIFDQITSTQNIDSNLFCGLVATAISLGPLPKRVLSALTDLANNAEEIIIRIRAIEALARIGHLTTDAINALTGLTQNTENNYIQIEAIEALARIAHRTTDAINTLTQNTEDISIQIEAIEALARIAHRTTDAINALTHLTQNTENNYIQIRAIKILARIGHLTPDTINTLTHLTQNTENNHIQIEAIEALARIGHLTPDTINTLTHLTQNTENNHIQIRAIKILARIAHLTPDTINTAVRLVTAANDEITRAQAVEAIDGALPADEVVETLGQLVRDDDWSVRHSARTTFVKLAGQHREIAERIQSILAAACFEALSASADQHDRWSKINDTYDALWQVSEVVVSRT